MSSRQDLVDWVYEALVALGGEGRVVDAAKHIWAHHESDLRASGNLFYTWQYDMRWAAMILRKQGKAAAPAETERGVWAVQSEGN